MERIQVFLRLSIVLGNPAGVPSSLKNEKKSSEVFRRVPKSAFVSASAACAELSIGVGLQSDRDFQ